MPIGELDRNAWTTPGDSVKGEQDKVIRPWRVQVLLLIMCRASIPAICLSLETNGYVRNKTKTLSPLSVTRTV